MVIKGVCWPVSLPVFSILSFFPTQLCVRCGLLPPAPQLMATDRSSLWSSRLILVCSAPRCPACWIFTRLKILSSQVCLFFILQLAPFQYPASTFATQPASSSYLGTPNLLECRHYPAFWVQIRKVHFMGTALRGSWPLIRWHRPTVQCPEEGWNLCGMWWSCSSNNNPSYFP